MTDRDSKRSPTEARHRDERHEPLILVSNRLPVSLKIEDGTWQASRSSGGLAAALAGVAEDDPLVWVGWPGCPVPDTLQSEVTDWMARDDLAPVFLSEEEENLYYHQISNQVFWPLFHYFADKIDFTQEAWQTYVEINQRFADRVLEIAEPNSRVWVQDFHLTLVPGMLRAAQPDLEIGFFLHIPFPSSEIYRAMPAREQVLRGLLGADYVGFHTHDYARHFRSSCLRVLGMESEHNAIVYEGRRVAIGVHPIGVDVRGFERHLSAPETAEAFAELKQRYDGQQVILGVERLDYTKGMLLKMQGFARLLEKRPDLRGKVSMLQIVVPSRLDNPDYQKLKSELEEFIGRLNGEYGRPGYTPFEYLHRSVLPHQLVALYRCAEVCMVTPIRDGMNLVAQEYLLCQEQRDQDELDGAHRGVLVLSEFAGAAQVLPRALMCNPWDIEQVANVLETALEMPADERQHRGAMMVEQVRSMDCAVWARNFLGRQSESAAKSRAWYQETRLLGASEEDEMLAVWRSAPRRHLMLDYDGTLRELARTPEEAQPTEEIYAVLNALCADDRNDVHIVSGRHREDLQGWFGDLPVHLSAEHGFAWRQRGADWAEIDDRDLSWLPRVQDILLDVSDEVPGTRIERKPAALAWHYRMADLDYGVWRARQLHSQLEQDLAHLPVDILHGHRIIEVRSAGVSKGGYVGSRLEGVDPANFILCIGDDRTDIDMYRALPDFAFSVHVGAGADHTRFSIASPAKVRALLARLAEH